MIATLRKALPFLILAIAMIMGVPEAQRFQLDGDSQHLWYCAIWGLIAGGAVSVILMLVVAATPDISKLFMVENPAMLVLLLGTIVLSAIRTAPPGAITAGCASSAFRR